MDLYTYARFGHNPFAWLATEARSPRFQAVGYLIDPDMYLVYHSVGDDEDILNYAANSGYRRSNTPKPSIDLMLKQIFVPALTSPNDSRCGTPPQSRPHAYNSSDRH